MGFTHQLTFDLLLDGLRGIQPVFDVVGIHELQSKVVLFDDIQGIEYLLVQEAAQRFFLQAQRGEN